MRGYVMIDLPGDFNDEGEASIHREAREALVEELANKWSIHNTSLEQARWSRNSRDYWIDYGEHLDELKENGVLAEEDRVGRKLTQEEEERISDEIEARLQAQDPVNKHRAAMDLIEIQLECLQARMMRPYEHHNEEERYYEYMETRYDNDYDY